MLLPVCTSDDCSESSVYVYSSGRVGSYALDPDKEITKMLPNDYWLHGLLETWNFSFTELNIYLSDANGEARWLINTSNLIGIAMYT